MPTAGRQASRTRPDLVLKECVRPRPASGGRPVRSSVTRRISVRASASAARAQSFAIQACLDESVDRIRIARHPPAAHWDARSVDRPNALRTRRPRATHWRIVSFCAAVSSLWRIPGGMIRASVAKMRWMISLFSGSPGTIGITPGRGGFSASSRMSRRRPAMRELLSGPWQRKQVSDMIGRMSRLKLTAPWEIAAGAAMAHNATIQLGRMIRW